MTPLFILRLVLETWCPHHWFSFSHMEHWLHSETQVDGLPSDTPRIHLAPHLSCLIHVILCLDHCSLLANLFCSCTSIVHSPRVARVILFTYVAHHAILLPACAAASYQSTVKLSVFLAPKPPGWPGLWLPCWPRCLSLFCSRTGLLAVPGTRHARSRLKPLATVCLQYSSPSGAVSAQISPPWGAPSALSKVTSPPTPFSLTLPWFIYVFYLLSFPLSLGYKFHEGRNFFSHFVYCLISRSLGLHGFSENIIWYAGHITMFFLTIILVH